MLGYVPAASGSAGVGTLLAANNLSDLESATATRANLGLGSLAIASSVDLGSASATGIMVTARIPALIGNTINYNTGNVGIGTASPNNKLEVAGTILTTGSASIGTNLINDSFGNSTSRTFMNSTGYIWSTMASGGGSANYYAHRHETASPFISFGYGVQT